MDDLEVRDLFAMLAMCGLVVKLPIKDFNREAVRPEYDDIAFSAYEYADAMIKARKYVEPEAGIVSINKRKRTQ
jgi:hypothetical protein